jgi:hypothetical protein
MVKQKEEHQIYWTTCVLWCSVFKIHFTVKRHKLLNYQPVGRPAVTKGVPSSAWHGIVSNPTLTCCHRPLLHVREVLPPQNLTTKEASMPSVLELLCAKTVISALQLEVHLQVGDEAPEQCPRQLSHAWGRHWTNVLHLSIECYVKWARL